MDENREASTQQSGESAETPPKKQKGEKGLYIKVIALALCCSLVGGLVGAGGVLFAGNRLEKDISRFQATGELLIKSRPGLGTPFLFTLAAIKDFVEDEIIRVPYIGVSTSDSDEPEGALIERVKIGGPAAKCGLQEGDIVTMAGDTKIDSSGDLADFVDEAEVGDEWVLTVYRQGETLECTVVIGERSLIGK